jgi:hypothetical protein
MTNINFGQTVQIIANLGVIAGIVFLGIELQQNNELLGAEARANRTQIRIASADQISNNPALMQAIVKQLDGEPLTTTDTLLLAIDAARSLAGWQYIYGEFQAGLIDETDIPVDNWRYVFSIRPEFKRAFDNNEFAALRPDFRQWMQENVVE